MTRTLSRGLHHLLYVHIKENLRHLCSVGLVMCMFVQVVINLDLY